MFSRISGSFYRTAAWRLALRSTLVFAAGSAAIFVLMYFVVARAVRERSDSWLIGESEVLKQVALATSRDVLYEKIVEEVAELATEELAYDATGHRTQENTVFFMLTDPRGALRALCGALGIPFSEAMLRWPAGPRASDGVWAPAWYDAVERSTGFEAPRRSAELKLDPPLRQIANAARPYYERLAKHRLVVG